MRKGVGAHHGLVGLHHKAGDLADHAAGGDDVLCIDAHFQSEIILACLEGHDGFFERAVPGAFSQSVDGAFDLARATDLHTRQ